MHIFFVMNKPFILPVMGIGFLIWLLATLAFRIAGQYFFIAESKAILIILYLAVVPALALISLGTFKKFKLSGWENVVGGALMVLPGIIIDTYIIQFFETVFPNMPAIRAATFGSWLMWAYSIVLLTSLIVGWRQHKRSIGN